MAGLPHLRPPGLRGKQGVYGSSTLWVLDSGEVVEGDGETFPTSAMAAESRYPPLVRA